jgi:hypothetical protein
MKKIIQPILIIALFLVTYEVANAQEVPNARVSPTMISAATINDAYIKVVYGMPLKKEREVFGGLVPFGEIWRTGANEATEITLTKTISFNGVDVLAGHYSLLTIPNENEWTIIFNKSLGMWGAFNYEAENDVVRFTVPSEALIDEWEAFRILLITEEGSNSLQMKWDKTGVTIPFIVK